MKGYYTIGRLQETAEKTTEGKKQVENMSPSAKKAYNDGLLHIVPPTLPGSDFVGISLAELQENNYVESRIPKDKPQRTYKKDELVQVFVGPPLGEFGMEKVLPKLIVNIDYKRTKFLILQFGSRADADSFFAETAAVFQERLKKALRFESISGIDYCKVMLADLVALPKHFEYRMWWHDRYHPVVCSVYDIEDKREYRRGHLLFDIFLYYINRISTSEASQLGSLAEEKVETEGSVEATIEEGKVQYVSALDKYAVCVVCNKEFEKGFMIRCERCGNLVCPNCVKTVGIIRKSRICSKCT